MPRLGSSVLGALALSWSLAACAVNPWKFELEYSPPQGDFTVRYSYCVGERCPAPESFGAGPKFGHGWHRLVAIHAASGLEFYRDGRRVALSEAQDDPFYSAALIMGWGMANRNSTQTLNGFRLVGMNLDEGYMCDTRIEAGVHRQ